MPRWRQNIVDVSAALRMTQIKQMVARAGGAARLSDSAVAHEKPRRDDSTRPQHAACTGACGWRRRGARRYHLGGELDGA